MKIRIAECLLRLCAWLPLWLLRGLGRLVGHWLWWSRSRSRLVTERNVALCMPQEPVQRRRQLAREHLDALACTALELGPLWFRSGRSLEKMVREVEGSAHVESALSDRRGVIILAPHLGNWELLSYYLGSRYAIHAMYLPYGDSRIDELVRGARSRSGATLVPAERRGVKRLLTVLREGGVIGVLPDQEPKRGNGVYAPFFGRAALTMTLAGNLAARTGSVPVCAFAERVRGGFAIRFQAAAPGLDDPDPVKAATALNRSVEHCVRRCAEQYQWEYKRFKAQPDGVKLYSKAALRTPDAV